MPTYKHSSASATQANAFLWPALEKIVGSRNWTERRAFDLGCGNGATGDFLSKLGFEVTGVDVSESGIDIAREAFPHVKAHIGSAYDDLAGQYGTFPLVVSLEVVEHCFDPHSFAKTFLNLIAPGGLGIVSTPYHSYSKNVALAITGKMESHFTVLWPSGHIKFFSINTLTRLLKEAGASDIRFERVGRIPLLAKSMIAICDGN